VADSGVRDESIRSRIEKVDIDAMCKSPVVDRELCESMRAEALRPLDTLPKTEVRHLIHGDLHGNNLLTEGNRITGVIDLAQAAYGDFLYDIRRRRPLDWRAF
jgi:Ser/Thr protein kinase RdoA (MazF antagonist)